MSGKHILYIVLAAFVSVVFSLMIKPTKDTWISFFGSEEDRALKEYQDSLNTARRDSMAQVATIWKRKREAHEDSITQAEKQKRALELLCVQQEIDKSKTNPCQSTLVFHQTYSSHSLPTAPPGLLDNPPLDWLVSSTQCNPDIKVPIQTYENGIFPFVLRQKEWIRWQFGVIQGRRITAQQLTRFFNLCE